MTSSADDQGVSLGSRDEKWTIEKVGTITVTRNDDGTIRLDWPDWWMRSPDGRFCGAHPAPGGNVVFTNPETAESQLAGTTMGGWTVDELATIASGETEGTP